MNFGTSILTEYYPSPSRCQNKFSQRRLFASPSQSGGRTGSRKGWHAMRLAETEMAVKTKAKPHAVSKHLENPPNAPQTVNADIRSW